MISFSYLLTLLLILNINSFFNNVLTDPDEVPSNIKLIDLDLKNINTYYFDIIKDKNGSESYKLTPKIPYKIKLLIVNKNIIWSKSDKSELLNFTVYNTPGQVVLFVFNTVNDGITRYIHMMKYGQTIGYMGLFNFLYELNEHTIKNHNKKFILNVSDHFDKLYHIYITYTLEDLIHESFLSRRNEKIFEVIDNAQTIWEYTPDRDGNVEISCRLVDTFKVKKYETIKENYETIHKSYQLYKLIIIKLDNDKVIYFKLDEGLDRWAEINKEEFLKIYIKLGFNKMNSGCQSRRGGEIDTDTGNNNIDISKRRDDFEYYKYGIQGYKIMNLTPKNQKYIDNMTYNNEFKLTIKSSQNHIVITKGVFNWTYIEVISVIDIIARPIYYITKYSRTTKWNVLNQEDFFDKIESEIEGTNEADLINYKAIRGLEDGIKVNELSELMVNKLGCKNIPILQESNNEVINYVKQTEGTTDTKHSNEQETKEIRVISNEEKDNNINIGNKYEKEKEDKKYQMVSYNGLGMSIEPQKTKLDTHNVVDDIDPSREFSFKTPVVIDTKNNTAEIDTHLKGLEDNNNDNKSITVLKQIREIPKPTDFELEHNEQVEDLIKNVIEGKDRNGNKIQSNDSLDTTKLDSKFEKVIGFIKNIKSVFNRVRGNVEKSNFIINQIRFCINLSALILVIG